MIAKDFVSCSFGWIMGNRAAHVLGRWAFLNSFLGSPLPKPSPLPKLLVVLEEEET